MKSSLRIRNGPLTKSLSKASDPILKDKRWGLSMEEFRRGWLSGLKPVTNFDRFDDVLSPRFCISGKHGLQEPKYRLADDLTKSLA